MVANCWLIKKEWSGGFDTLNYPTLVFIFFGKLKSIVSWTVSLPFRVYLEGWTSINLTLFSGLFVKPCLRLRAAL